MCRNVQHCWSFLFTTMHILSLFNVHLVKDSVFLDLDLVLMSMAILLHHIALSI